MSDLGTHGEYLEAIDSTDPRVSVVMHIYDPSLRVS
jgi:hypothetical protein